LAVAEELRIRAAAQAELRLLAELCHRSSLAGYPFSRRILIRFFGFNYNAAIDHFWGDGTRTILLAEGDGGITGFVSFKPDKTEAELVALFVDPAHWRLGIGRALVEESFRILTQSETQSVFVVSNPKTVPFYEALGFRQTGTVDVPHWKNAPRLLRHL
jgi:GNAT superfamily N-acetyltransferase